MSEPQSASDDTAPPDGSPPPFRCSQNPADAHTAGQARAAFGAWLTKNCQLATTITQDVLLAVNEALANAVEHAYAGTSGNVDLAARYDVRQDTLKVIVEDHGHWRQADPAPPLRVSRRGRGLVLMRALTDDTTIESTDEGTRVSLTWRGPTKRAG
jgi:anti-sigma regulatory factor (Ser/Thr protein kinase)